jgi:uncharacterized protein YkwD
MNRTRKARRELTLAALSLSVILAACGGGGGGSSDTSSSAPPPSPAPTPAPAPSTGTLDAPQYPSGSAELDAFNQLNSMRTQCGFPPVKENTLLDQAAANHMLYMQDNRTTGHYETSGNPGFTGVAPSDRGVQVGYGANVGELNAQHAADVGGALSIIGLASLPYHEVGLFTPVPDFGSKYSSIVMGPTTTYHEPEFTLGYQSTPSQINGGPLTFPCQGTTGVDFESNGKEAEMPMGLDTFANPIGTSVAVMGNLTDTITLSSGQMTDPNGNVINLLLLDSAKDSNHLMQPYEAAAFPANPLQPNTTYGVTVTGTVNGTAFSRSFTFTTGAQGQF